MTAKRRNYRNSFYKRVRGIMYKCLNVIFSHGRVTEYVLMFVNLMTSDKNMVINELEP